MNKYSHLILTYGYPPMLMLLQEMEQAENYEVCELIEKGFLGIEKNIDIKYPRKLTDDVLKDYKADFWRMGLSGDIAESNFYSYYEEIKKELNL